MDEVIVTTFLAGDAYWIINKTLSKLVGNDAAILFSDLVSKEAYFRSKNQLVEGKWFFNTQENIEQDTNLSPYKQRECIKTLKDYGFIQTKYMGLPKKLYFQINHSAVIKKFNDLSLKNLTTCSKKIKPLDVKNFNHYINNNNKLNNNKLNNNKEDISKDMYIGNPKGLPMSSVSVQANKPKFRRTAPKQGEMRRKLHEKFMSLPTASNTNRQHKPNPYIEYWNSLPNTRKHKRPNSKVYQEAVKLLRQLEKGEFGVKNRIDRDWLAKHNIPDKWLTHSYSEAEIKKTLEHISRLLTPGYWPEDKTVFRSMSLAAFLYNANLSRSWFLKVFVHPPKPLAETVRNPELIELVREYVQWCGNELDASDRAVEANMVCLSKLYKALPEEVFRVRERAPEGIVTSDGYVEVKSGLFYHLCPTDKMFIKQYMDWLFEQRGIQRRTASLLNPKSKMFQKWIAQFDEDSNPTRKALTTIIQENRLL